MSVYNYLLQNLPVQGNVHWYSEVVPKAEFHLFGDVPFARFPSEETLSLKACTFTYYKHWSRSAGVTAHHGVRSAYSNEVAYHNDRCSKVPAFVGQSRRCSAVGLPRPASAHRNSHLESFSSPKIVSCGEKQFYINKDRSSFPSHSSILVLMNVQNKVIFNVHLLVLLSAITQFSHLSARVKAKLLKGNWTKGALTWPWLWLKKGPKARANLFKLFSTETTFCFTALLLCIYFSSAAPPRAAPLLLPLLLPRLFAF